MRRPTPKQLTKIRKSGWTHADVLLLFAEIDALSADAAKGLDPWRRLSLRDKDRITILEVSLAKAKGAMAHARQVADVCADNPNNSPAELACRSVVDALTEALDELGKP